MHRQHSSILARIPGFRQRIIPEPHVPSFVPRFHRFIFIISIAKGRGKINLWNLWVLPSGNEIGFLAEVIGVYISS
jgi:hypothetical protein